MRKSHLILKVKEGKFSESNFYLCDFFYQVIPCTVKCFKFSWLFHLLPIYFPSAKNVFNHLCISKYIRIFSCFLILSPGREFLTLEWQKNAVTFSSIFSSAYLSLCFCLSDSVASGRVQRTSGLTSQPLTNAHNTHILLSARFWIITNKTNLYFGNGFPRWCTGKESACRCKRSNRCTLNQLWKIPWSRNRQTTLVFLARIPWTKETW